jgi:hypothetical protein
MLECGMNSSGSTYIPVQGSNETGNEPAGSNIGEVPITNDATWYPRRTHASVVPLTQPRNSTVESEMSSFNEM